MAEDDVSSQLRFDEGLMNMKVDFVNELLCKILTDISLNMYGH